MCGIIGILGRDDVAPRIVSALKHLEYRGYDSAGVATVDRGELDRRRTLGKLNNLSDLLSVEPLPGKLGIGHTRWATHGAPSVANAHPHASRRVSIVHNGIIENFRELRGELETQGHSFHTETDSEVIAHLITEHLDRDLSPAAAVEATLARLHGAFAIGVLFAGEDDLMVAARRGSPLVLGHGDGEMYLGSDALALAPMTNRVCFLEEGDWAVLSRSGADIRDADGKSVTRTVRTVSVSATTIGKGNHRHFMEKEIYEQPEAVGHTLSGYLRPLEETVALPASIPFEDVSRISLAACGTAFYAGMVGKYWIEKLARLPVEIDIASEFRYREPLALPGSLALFVSQSGETADTLAALRYCREAGMKTASIVNVPESSIARESDFVLPTHAGPEIGVASTKAFTCQLSVLASLAVAAGRARGTLSRDDEIRLTRALTEVPGAINAMVAMPDFYTALGHDLAKARDVLFLGRGSLYPIAMEGALKLKEISYIHAEGYAAGELKHGPIALIDEDVPVIVLAPRSALFEKTISNMQEVIARGGRVVLVSDKEGLEVAGGDAWRTIEIPPADPFVAPLLYTIPMQLIAYFTALDKGTDVDQPRNLAKSVTVE